MLKALEEDADEDVECEDVMARMIQVSELFDAKIPDMGSKKLGKRIEMRKHGKPLNMFIKESARSSTPSRPHELCSAVEYKTVQDGWVRVRGVMDSGASEPVAPPDMCPHCDFVPSPGSIAGQGYVSASDGVMPNLGEQLLDVVTADGYDAQVKYQMANVSRPLNSVSEICDAGGDRGQYVIFGRGGGAIINLETGRQTPFDREEGICMLDLWVKPKAAAGPTCFRRQG